MRERNAARTAQDTVIPAKAGIQGIEIPEMSALWDGLNGREEGRW